MPTNIESPKVVVSARNIAQERSLQFANNEIAEPTNPPGRGVIQSQEGALNVVPRPRFKMPEGMTADHQESVLSHYS